MSVRALDDRSPGLAYGGEVLSGFLPPGAAARVLAPEDPPQPLPDPAAALERALAAPLAGAPLASLVRARYVPGRQVLVLVDDHTRPCRHTRLLLPPLLGALRHIGVRRGDMAVLVASGTHRPPTAEELERHVLGPSAARALKGRVLVHDCDGGNEPIGATPRGTPVLVDERVLRAALVIPLTDSEYHYFAGQAGTAKSICPGVAGRETIQANHVRMFDPERGFRPACELGSTRGNPVIEDALDVARIVGERVPLFGVDAVMGGGGPVHLAAGRLEALHRAAAPVLERRCTVRADRPADIAVVSAGAQGLDLFQAIKAVHCGWNAVRKDGRGRVVALAPCPNGVGSDAFAEAMEGVAGLPLREALSRVLATRCTRETFVIGDHKSVDLLRIVAEVGEGRVHVLTGLDPEKLRRVYRLEAIPAGPDPAASLRTALAGFAREHGGRPLVHLVGDPSVLVLTSAQGRRLL